MSLSIEIDQNLKDLSHILGQLKSKGTKRALRSAINTTLRNTQTELSKHIRKELNLGPRKHPPIDPKTNKPSAYIKSFMKMKKPDYGLSMSRIKGKLSISRRGVSLMRFKPNIQKRFIKIKVKRGAATKQLKHAFVAKLRRGNVHIVERNQKTNKLKPLFSTNIADSATNHIPQLSRFILNRYQINLNRQIQRQLFLINKHKQ